MYKMFATLFIAAALPAAALAAKPDAYVGRWISPCEDGNFCRIYIQKAHGNNHFTFSFMTTKPGNKPSDDCEWHVDMTYSKTDGFISAMDPYGNYGFYVKVQKDGSLYSSGTMLPVCGGQRSLDQTFQKDGSDEYEDE